MDVFSDFKTLRPVTSMFSLLDPREVFLALRAQPPPFPFLYPFDVGWTMAYVITVLRVYIYPFRAEVPLLAELSDCATPFRCTRPPFFMPLIPSLFG